MHPGELAELDMLRDIAARLGAAGHGQRGAIMQAGARTLGVSEQTLYNRLRRVGYSSGRKLRRDAGDTRVGMEGVKAVASILQASRRTTGKRLLPVGDAIDVAVSNGLLNERVSESTMLRIMRREGCHPSQLAQDTPHVSMRSLHPNHVWQLDASICVIYYLRSGRVRVMDERKFNERKPNNLGHVANKRVLRYAVTDHFTADTIARYYHTSGEDQRSLFDFLMYAFHPAPGRVMHGVPWMLVWDAGSANQSHGIGNLLTLLGVRHWAHVPGKSRAKGQVENAHNIIERKFEGRLSFVRTESVEELNAQLDTWLTGFNGADKHGRHGHTRDALWQTIRADQLRLCPPREVCEVMMHSKPEPRTVAGNLTISYKPRGHERATYSVAHVPHVRVGDKVDVITSAYSAPAICIVGKDDEGATRYWECAPVETVAGGFFASAPVFGERYAAHADTDVDTARKDANELAYGERDTLDAAAAKIKGAVAFNGAIDPFADLRDKAARTPTYMQRPGTQLHVSSPMYVDERPLTIVDLAQELRARRGSGLSADELARVKSLHPDDVIPAEAFAALVETLLRGDLPAAPEAPAAASVPRLYAVR